MTTSVVPGPAPAVEAVALVSVVVTACFVWLVVDFVRARRGAQWLATLAGGVLFGEVVEWLNTHDSPLIPSRHVAYAYPDLPLDVFGVPFWVPLGWGAILTMSAWTAERLALPRWARPIASAFLATSIDFSLDPVARLCGLWSWQRVPVSFAGVPYDNFLGWYLIGLVYSGAAGWVVRAKPRSDLTWPRVATAALSAATLALLALFAVLWALFFCTSYAPRTDDGRPAAILFAVATAAGAWVTLRLARPAHASTRDVSWPVLVAPAAIHATSFALLLASARRVEEPLLVAAIPLQLLAGTFLFARPSLDALRGIDAKPAATHVPAARQAVESALAEVETIHRTSVGKLAL